MARHRIRHRESIGASAEVAGRLAVSERLSGARAGLIRVVGAGAEAAAVLWRRYLAPVVGTLTGVGRAIGLVGLIGWLLAWKLGWIEMAVIATACIVLLAVAAVFTIGTTKLQVATVVEPVRVTVGEALTGELTVTNVARAPLVSAQVEFPIGHAAITFDLPVLMPGKQHSEIFVIPTDRRGVITVGPVTSVRGDPLGVFRRELAWTEQTEVYVHPRITSLEPLGAGLIRDLEGNSSQNVSMSDLSFHALREYVAGDDLRHVHWRSSAKHGQLLVRQFLDTRRSHLTAVVDADPAAYLSEDDYETAISAAASLLVRALRDGYDVSFLSGTATMTKATGRSALDACSRAQPEPASLVDVAAHAARIAVDTSVVFLVTGPGTEYLSLQRAAGQFGVETGRAALRVDSSKTPGLRTSGDLPVMTVASLDQLGLVLRWGLG
jgi:hypothetical protein